MGAVLCVAGRGPLDDAAALIFAQLLRRRGFGVRLISFRAASRRRISALEAGGAMLACLLYLDISGRPAHLRYLLERLRHRVAEAPVLIGLWPGADNATRDRDRREQLRVDYCAASLREALEQCEAASRARPVARAAVAAARPERVTPG